MPRSPSGASARPSPRVSIKSLELNALHTSRIQDMVHLNGNRSKPRDHVGRGARLHRVRKGVRDVFTRNRQGDAARTVPEYGWLIVDGNRDVKAARIAQPFYRLIIKVFRLFQVPG